MWASEEESKIDIEQSHHPHFIVLNVKKKREIKKIECVPMQTANTQSAFMVIIFNFYFSCFWLRPLQPPTTAGQPLSAAGSFDFVRHILSLS